MGAGQSNFKSKDLARSLQLTSCKRIPHQVQPPVTTLSKTKCDRTLRQGLNFKKYSAAQMWLYQICYQQQGKKASPPSVPHEFWYTAGCTLDQSSFYELTWFYPVKAMPRPWVSSSEQVSSSSFKWGTVFGRSIGCTDMGWKSWHKFPVLTWDLIIGQAGLDSPYLGSSLTCD